MSVHGQKCTISKRDSFPKIIFLSGQINFIFNIEINKNFHIIFNSYYNWIIYIISAWKNNYSFNRFLHIVRKRGLWFYIVYVFFTYLYFSPFLLYILEPTKPVLKLLCFRHKDKKIELANWTNGAFKWNEDFKKVHNKLDNLFFISFSNLISMKSPQDISCLMIKWILSFFLI